MDPIGEMVARTFENALGKTELKPPAETGEAFGMLQKQTTPPLDVTDDPDYELPRAEPFLKTPADVAVLAGPGAGYVAQPRTFLGDETGDEGETNPILNELRLRHSEGIYYQHTVSPTPASEPAPQPQLVKRETITPKTPEKIPALTETFTHRFRVDGDGDVWRDKIDSSGDLRNTYMLYDPEEIAKALQEIVSRQIRGE